MIVGAEKVGKCELIETLFPRRKESDYFHTNDIETS